ncbi:metallophosphoesterase [Telmatospirillum sp.]|uniref:metallophosphoesterase family protein n=1 Tax=Telmatospirillum sp. TaxID=2079197 RepID=UPI00284FEDCE|nr:metallophosphoesterase [Telmatospirillum sp.]MDR3437046.1 metallophosphoesterase [Telmatospirillum sp.]
MTIGIGRRDLFKLAGIGGLVFASGLPGAAWAEPGTASGNAAQADFYFLQLSDSHWGFVGAPNPDAAGTLPKTVETVNSLDIKPDFVVFTGDLTQTTDDAVERKRRMLEFKDIVGKLSVQDIHFLPGEHDASLDLGATYREVFGQPYYSFDHKGVHFIALDNVSDPGSRLGETQLGWLRKDLAAHGKTDKIVVLAHRPLFDLYPQWDWATADGAQALELLIPFAHVTVFYGHIHQENHHMTGQIAHHSAKSLIFPLPAAGSTPKRTPVPWNPAEPYAGLGFRSIKTDLVKSDYGIVEYPVVRHG